MTRSSVKDFFIPETPITVDPIEIDNGESIPTYELMKQMQATFGGTHQVYFLMGSDLLPELHLWDDRIIQEVPCLVVHRKGFSLASQDAPGYDE